jgi:hypothetical protein
MNIEIVTHCYCPPGVDQYAQHLKWQWASLVHHAPFGVMVTLCVCYTPDDQATVRILDAMENRMHAGSSLLCVGHLPLPQCQLFRRAIGRNQRALLTAADIIWFADVDYLFGRGCLETLARLADANSGLMMPDTLHINHSNGEAKSGHQVGYEMVESARGDDLPAIQAALFTPRPQKICIGGCHILGGKLARRIGYLKHTKWVQPVEPSHGFRSCRCDVAFRRLNKLTATRLPLPNVYRIRHLCAGRDYDLNGDHIGKDAW